MTSAGSFPTVELMAKRKKIPRNQYQCRHCGGRHVYNSQRGFDCGRVTTGTAGARKPPARTDATQPVRNHVATSPSRSPQPAGGPRSRDNGQSSSWLDPLPDTRPEVRTALQDNRHFYTGIAADLRAHAPRRGLFRRRGHRVCVLLDDSAQGLDPRTYTRLATEPVGAALRAFGFPEFLADALGATSALGIHASLGTIPIGSMTQLLRVLIPLVCPDFPTCPTRTEVNRTYSSPVLGEQLRGLAASNT